MNTTWGPRFFDADILVYTQDHADAYKQSRALATVAAAMTDDCFVTSPQAMQEFSHVVLQRHWLSPIQVSQFLRHLSEHTVVPCSSETVMRALELQQRYSLSVWDAMTVQAAFDARCTVLFSEDLPDGFRFSPVSASIPELCVVNPFTASSVAGVWEVHEPVVPYQVKVNRRRVTRAAK